MPILFIDDDLTWGELIQYALTERCGIAIDWFVRARQDGDKIIVMNADGKESELDTSKYACAMIDGRLRGSSLDGWQLTPLLVARGLAVIATSGASTLNDQMIKCGASAGIAKDQIVDQALAALKSGKPAKPEFLKAYI